MIIKRQNDRSNEYVRTFFKNTATSSLTQGIPVCQVTALAASVDGLSAVHSLTSSFRGFIGISRSSVAANGFGLADSWGKTNSILLSNEGTSISVTVGDLLLLVTGTGLGMSSIGGATFDWANMNGATAGTTVNVSAAGYSSNCIVRALM